ncbi:hypothetical protein [Actinocrispum wychmicini]|uniref:DUF3040 family protein n=1 Tax=Actinocrispum wychmicini TaxID=1213861 RepID=A0A4R2JXM3_9PSEU|nr:hypothetical protein [Actinocrispum wychmicini]TCO62168.1 hypothetical protein EV192_102305 [Actinocrispum wychmicini]
MSDDVTVERHAETGRDNVHAFLATIEHIVDSPGRTDNARRLLLPVLISVVLVLTAVVIVAVLAPAWALGAAGSGAVVAGYRRLSRGCARRSRR